MREINLEIKPDPQGGFTAVDVDGVIGQPGEDLGGAPDEQEAKNLVEEIKRALRTGEGR